MGARCLLRPYGVNGVLPCRPQRFAAYRNGGNGKCGEPRHGKHPPLDSSSVYVIGQPFVHHPPSYRKGNQKRYTYQLEKIF